MLKSRSVVPAAYDSSRNVNEQMMTGPIARPSSPSVRLTAFDSAISTKTANATYAPSGSASESWWKLTSGSASRSRTSGGSAVARVEPGHRDAADDQLARQLQLAGQPLLVLREIFR